MAPLPAVFNPQNARLPITNAIKARLAELTWLSVHVGEINSVDDLPLLPGKSGRVAPYAVIHPSPGETNLNPNLEASLEGGGDFLWTGQITFTAGYALDLLDTLDQAIPHLHLWSPQVPGIDCGPMRPPLGYNPGPVRRNDKARPSRVWTPTLWQIHTA